MLENGDRIEVAPALNLERTQSLLSNYSHGESRRKVGALGVALLTFFNVSGGPWGSEPIVSSAGPFFGFIVFGATILCWSLPFCLVTAELSSALPNNGGYGTF